MQFESEENLRERFEQMVKGQLQDERPLERTEVFQAFKVRASVLFCVDLLIRCQDACAEKLEELRAASGVEEEMGEDDELVVATQTSSFKCPLTQKIMTDPVTSAVCKHSYERAAIEALLRQNRRGPLRCPIAGCPKSLTMKDLAPNPKLLRQIQKQHRQQQPQAAAGRSRAFDAVNLEE